MKSSDAKRYVGMAMIAGLGTADAIAGEDSEKVEAYSNVSVQSKYVAQKGFTVVDNPVVQGAVGFGTERVKFDIWTSYDPDKKGITEVDMDLSVPFNFEYFQGRLRGRHFTFPGLGTPEERVPDAEEAALIISSKRLPLTATAYFAHIFGHETKPGQFFSGTLSKGFGLTPKVDLNVATSVSYNEHFFTEGTGFSHATGSVSLPIRLGAGFTLTPNLTAQKRLEDNFDGAFKDEFITGVALNKSF